MDLLTKIIFHLKKTKIIIIAGRERNYAADSVLKVLRPYFSVEKFSTKMPNIFTLLKNQVIIIEISELTNKILKKAIKLTQFSCLPIFVFTESGEKEVEKIKEVAKQMPSYGFLILNFDDKKVVGIKSGAGAKTLTFGFEEGADFRASDVNTNHGANFKINYEGKIIPIWQEFVGKEHIYAALAASCVGVALGLNFVEISDVLKK